MSVRLENRGTSKSEFLNIATEIQTDTAYLVTRLSNRMKRTVGDPIVMLIHKVVSQLYAANKVRIEDQISFNLRRSKFLSALSDLDSFEVDLNLVYSVLRRNPEGAYRTESGLTMKAKEAMQKIDRRVALIVAKKDLLENMVKSIVRKDKEKFPNYFK